MVVIGTRWTPRPNRGTRVVSVPWNTPSGRTPPRTVSAPQPARAGRKVLNRRGRAWNRG